MRYALVGLLYDQGKEKELLSKIGYSVQPQVNQYQWGLIEGLNANLNTKIDVFASIPVGSFPKHSKKLCVKKDIISSDYGVNYIPFTAISGIREIQRTRRFFKAIKSYVNESSDKVTIFIYSVYYPFTTLIKKLKRKFGDKVQVCLIVPDLPGKFGIERKNPIRRFLDRKHIKGQFEGAKQADKYVLLTDAMKKPLEVGDKKYAVVEGFLPTSAIEKDLGSVLTDKKVFLYTGSISYELGVWDLVKEFSMVKSEGIELHLYGKQNQLTDKIVEYSSTVDARVKFKGFLPKEDVLKAQQSAFALVNPRPDKEQFTKYSFPSKTMEYMLSARPVIMHELSGLPSEYKPYLMLLDKDSEFPIKEKIESLLDMDNNQIIDMGEKAKRFVLENKNAIAQTEKIIKIL